MKKFLLPLAVLCMGMAAFTSCTDEDDVPPMSLVSFEGDAFAGLIDSPQYGGPLLYGADASSYAWADPVTSLTGGMTNAWGGQYGFAEGGAAISNYVDADIQAHNTYNYQLAVPQSNGSQNFVVVYCDATVRFADGKARALRSFDVSPTTYVLSAVTYGDGYAASLAQEGNLTLTITADNGKTLDVDFARDGHIMQGWTTVDLASLGAVTSLTFTMDGSDRSEYGVKHPKYFAFDNLVVLL